MAPNPLFTQIAQLFDASLGQVTKLTGGSSAIVHALDLHPDTKQCGEQASEQHRVVVRQHGDTDSGGDTNFKGHGATVASKEFGVTQALHSRGFAVPKPLLHQGGDWLVTEWVEGTSHVDPANLTSALDQMVDALVRLHRVDADQLAMEGLAVLEDPLQALPQYLLQDLAEPGDRLRAALQREDITRHANPAVVIHGDYWPGNMLWNRGELAAVIDWEDAAVGDPLADLACARVELLCQYGQQAMQYFTARYLDLTDLDTRSLPLWEAYVSASALATMHLWDITAAEQARRRAQTTTFFTNAVQALLLT